MHHLFANGFIPTSCHADPPACENNGYIIVEVTPTQITIQYKDYLGNVIHTRALP
jgi:hypothetical protein